jgi:hypothetical protein
MNDKKASEVFDVLSDIGRESEQFREMFIKTFNQSNDFVWPFSIASGVNVTYYKKRNIIDIDRDGYNPSGFADPNVVFKKIIKINSSLNKIK